MFSKEYDVAVVGGGVAGAAAAIQSARYGKKTALLEKSAFAGGLATSGLINVFLPLCDGNGRQVSFGICEEMLRRSIKYGSGDIPPNWRNERNAPERKRLISVFNPASFVLSLDEMLEECHVDVWFDTLVCDVSVENQKITAIKVENESGRGSVTAKQFIDASGSALLARR
ncbi:MAG: FAD-dependent oxidoreductase, partial [Victivallaceae bacterium]|nr:FAD-dependent oxidoreductase [Victivallaceae bacterium]